MVSNHAAVTTAPEAPDPATPPVFDPDPDLVADVEGNPFAVRSFRKAAEKAHQAAERSKAASNDG